MSTVREVGRACCEEISLRAGSMVGSTARAQQSRVPLMACTRVVPTLSSMGGMVGSWACCILAPQAGRTQSWGACWALAGLGCWNFCRVLLMQPGMDTSTWPLLWCHCRCRPQQAVPSQSVEILQCFCSVLMRWWACCGSACFVPKSSTHRAKVVGGVLCFQMPGECRIG